MKPDNNIKNFMHYNYISLHHQTALAFHYSYDGFALVTVFHVFIKPGSKFTASFTHINTVTILARNTVNDLSFLFFGLSVFRVLEDTAQCLIWAHRCSNMMFSERPAHTL